MVRTRRHPLTPDQEPAGRRTGAPKAVTAAASKQDERCDWSQMDACV